MMAKAVLGGLLLILGGCATRSGIIQDGPGTYSIILSGKTGFISSGDLKIKAYQQAAAHCSKQSKTLEVIDSQEQRGGILGKFPQAQIRFRCT